MTATYTFDVYRTLDGFGSYGSTGDWGGYWSTEGPEFLGHRLAVVSEQQRMGLGANTCRESMELLGQSDEMSDVNDPVNTRLRNMPTTVVSTTLQGLLGWPDATLAAGDAVDVVRTLKAESSVPLRSHGSPSKNRALLAAGLVDRVQVTFFPAISGQTGAQPVFRDAADLDLLESRTIESEGIQKLHSHRCMAEPRVATDRAHRRLRSCVHPLPPHKRATPTRSNGASPCHLYASLLCQTARTR